MIRAQTGRGILLIEVVAGFLLAFIVLFIISRGGAVSDEVGLVVMQRLLKLYVPLFGLMGAFYFSERGQATQHVPTSTSIESFLFACAVVGIWVGLPAMLLSAADTVEAVLRILDSFEVFGSTIAVSALAYYFSVSAREKRASAPARQAR